VTVFLVMCGADQLAWQAVEGEDAAIAAALEHDQLHHCSPWVQYPLEHVYPGE
jgi:hypothetical protein